MTRQNKTAVLGRGLIAAAAALTLFLLGSDARHLTMISEAYAACVDGTKVSCLVGNTVGTKECIGGRFAPCDITMPPPPPPPPPYPPVTQISGLFDLVPLDSRKPTDDNGLILNPQWRWQTISPNLLPDTGDSSTYCGSEPWKAPCTSYATTNDNWSGEKEAAIVALEAILYASSLGQLGSADASGFCGAGHQNWTPATYSGTIYWEAHSSPKGGDDDYNFRLVPPAVGKNSYGTDLGAGLTDTSDSIYPTTGEVTSPPDGAVEIWPLTRTPVNSTSALPSLEVEFDSEETVDNFSTPWWSAFHDAVDKAGAQKLLGGGGPSEDCWNGDTGQCEKLAAVENMINGKFAIVTGLFGLDCAHDCKPELHPVFAMAIRVKDDPSDEVWELFARRLGDEGFCSNNVHFIGDLPNDTFTFRFPSRGTSVEITQQTLASALSSTTVNFPQSDPRNGKLVSFVIPPPFRYGPNFEWMGDIVHGELHLQWSGNPPKFIPPPPFPTKPQFTGRRSISAPRPIHTVPLPGNTPTEQAEKPEDLIDQLVGSMTPTQRQSFYAAFPPQATPKHVAPVRVGTASVTGPRPRTKMRASVINPAQRLKDQQLLSGLHAAYGPKLDQNMPTGVKPKPICHQTSTGIVCKEP
jgi:hypothetical protein